jgi:predicted SnoaL-like aldol condensation-catalyzing enzyme
VTDSFCTTPGFPHPQRKEFQKIKGDDMTEQRHSEPHATAPELTEKPFLSTAARHEETRRRAYEIYLERGAHPGGELNDWLRAERELNKAFVLEAFDTLFNQRDYPKAERYWSANYIQHSAHIAPGREGLFNLVKSIPPTLKYEPGTIVAEGKFVIVHGRFSGMGLPVNWIAADILRIEDDVLAEHWTSFRTKLPKKNQRAVCPCLARTLLNDPAQPSKRLPDCWRTPFPSRPWSR